MRAARAGCGDTKAGADAPGKEKGPRDFPVRTAAAATMPVTYDIRVVGSLVEENRFVVPARVAGTAQDVAFKEGDRVTTGQQRLRIEYERFRLMADKADATVREQESVVKKFEADLAETVRKTSSTIDTARVDLDLAKSEFDRRATLQGAAISEEDRLAAELKYRRAKAVFDYAVAAVNTQVRWRSGARRARRRRPSRRCASPRRSRATIYWTAGSGPSAIAGAILSARSPTAST